jgi:hypothetical protein
MLVLIGEAKPSLLGKRKKVCEHWETEVKEAKDYFRKFKGKNPENGVF